MFYRPQKADAIYKQKSLFTTLFALALLLSFTAVAPKQVSAPAQALADAVKMYDEERYDRAAFFARRAAVEPLLKPWALVVEAESAEKQGNLSGAEKLYREVPAGKAAALDARLGLLRVELERTKKLSIDGGDIGAFDTELQRAGRTDLQQELLFLRGKVAATRGDYERATTLLNSVRRMKPSKDLALRARDLLWGIQARLEGDAPEASIGALVAEASQLLRENEPALAQTKITAAKKHLKPHTPAYYEALLVQEQAERALGKNDVANATLAEVAADGGPGLADQAMLKIIKNAWNKNDPATTLRYIEEYRRQFDKDTDELKFIEARTFDDTDRKEDALKLYRDLMQSGRDLSWKNRAIRQLAWAKYRENDFTGAARIFAEGAAITKESLDDAVRAAKAGYGQSDTDTDAARARVRSVRDVFDDYLHHRYWFADCLSRLDERERKKSFPSAESPEAVLHSIVDAAQYSYYGLLARKTLGLKEPLFPAQTAPGQYCHDTPDEKTLGALKLLHGAELREMSRAEIEWWLSHRGGPSQAALDLASAGGKRITLSELKTLLSRGHLFLEYAYPDKAVMLADSLFKRPRALEPFENDALRCLPELAQLAFPRPFSVDFGRVAETRKVPVSLLYAHARTESYFDPLARSPKDARGLMQLLPETATREGMPAGGDLFDPQLNLSFGAKHLAGLLDKYRGNPALAASAYNAGAAATDRWLDASPDAGSSAWVENITYPETRDYVKKVLLSRALYESN